MAAKCATRRCDVYEMVVHSYGPLFDGRASDALADFTHQLQWDLGQQAMADVHHIADISFKHPTPYYETQIQQLWIGPDVVVDDRGVIYGPWLEGVSERNQTTRFKGYHLWRRAFQRIDGNVTPFADRLLPHYLDRMD